jgi:hypothetical protein
MPHTEELAMLIVGDFSLEKYKKDIIVSSRNKGLQRIFFSSSTHGVTIPFIISIWRKRIPTRDTIS